MKRIPYNYAILVIILFAPFFISWGTFGHERINHVSVLCLPTPLRTFFYNHIDFITQESTVPDLRKYTLADRAEYPRHYMDLDLYGARDSLPGTLKEARKKYGEEFLTKNGTLPWYIKEMMEKLTKAFREKRKTEILFLAADLGHYIGDAHMPLHTTSNHDGQFTGQKGIHAFWESQLPELFGETFLYKWREASYIKDIEDEIWKIIFRSYGLVDSLLLAEKQARLKSNTKEMYERTENGEIRKNKFNQAVHSKKYATLFHDALNGMIEKQMIEAIRLTSGFWYTAWVNAGKPDLLDLDPPELNHRNKTNLKKELKLLEEGKLLPLKSESEF